VGIILYFLVTIKRMCSSMGIRYSCMFSDISLKFTLLYFELELADTC